MYNVFLAPHADDEALFGSYIIQRTKALIVVVTDSTLHEKNFGISKEQRRKESRQGASLLGADIKFLGIAEEDLTLELLNEKLRGIEGVIPWNFLFLPTKQEGNSQHDLISDFGKNLRNVLYYSTYSKESLVPTGEMAIIPTEEEKKIKEQALACYTSQHAINRPHFDAVVDQPEYLNFKQ